MPIYNGIEFIDESVCSIINQTFQDWELIIGINGHETNSQIYQIAKKYESKDTRINVYDLIDIKGKSNALNYMLKYTNYNWISLLDVDDVWLRDKLLLQVPYMDKYDIIEHNVNILVIKQEVLRYPLVTLQVIIFYYQILL